MSAANGSTDSLTGIGGEWHLFLNCIGGANARRLGINVQGTSAGGIDYSVNLNRDGDDAVSRMGGASWPGFTSMLTEVGNLTHAGGTNGHSFRMAGTLTAYFSGKVTTVTFAAYLDDTANQGTCKLRGTAVTAS